MSEARRPVAHRSMLDQILRGAEQAFLASGYDLATMDLVAKHAGVARGSVYNHFDSKEELFLAMMRRGIELFIERALREPEEHSDPRVRLRKCLVSFLQEASTPDAIEMYRTIVTMSSRFPALARMLHEQGLARVEAKIQVIAVDIGAASIPDPARFADCLLSMLMGGYFNRRLLDLPGHAADGSAADYVERSIVALLCSQG